MKQALGVIYDDKKMELAISSYEEKSISIDKAGLLKDDFKDRLEAYKVLTNKIREVISDKKN